MLLDAIAAIVLHEMAHILSALLLRVRIKKIGIGWKGPYIIREQGEPGKNLIIALAGPLANLVLCALVWHKSGDLWLCNLVLGIANLLPTPSSDGRRAAQCFREVWNLDSGSLYRPGASPKQGKLQALDEGQRVPVGEAERESEAA